MFVLIVVLLAAAAIVFVTTPLILTVGHWQADRPGLALAAWFGALFTGVGSAVAATVAAIIAAVGAGASAAEGIAITLAAWIGLGVAGAMIAAVVVAAEPLAAAHRDAVSSRAPVATARRRDGRETIVHFDGAEPEAFAVGGRSPEIFLSSGIRDLLPAPQLRAVVEHERAHLRLRHGLAVRIAEINASCLPRRSRAGADFRRNVLLLVELAADDAAAAVAGHRQLIGALTAVAHATGDPALALRAERLSWRDPAGAGATAAVPGRVRRAEDLA